MSLSLFEALSLIFLSIASISGSITLSRRNRLYAAANMFWGGQAIRLRVEMEVAVPLGFAMRWLASLTARGGVYYPYSDTTPVSF